MKVEKQTFYEKLAEYIHTHEDLRLQIGCKNYGRVSAFYPYNGDTTYAPIGELKLKIIAARRAEYVYNILPSYNKAPKEVKI